MNAEEKLEEYALILRNKKITVFSYDVQEDILILYDQNLEIRKQWKTFLQEMKEQGAIHPEDWWKITEFAQGRIREPIEIRFIGEDGKYIHRLLERFPVGENDELDAKEIPRIFCGSFTDVADSKKREYLLEIQAKHDSLTMLYNRFYGKELISEYLAQKNPYDSCGLMVIDIDYFKRANDQYGHSFGDEVLTRVAQLFRQYFNPKDIIMRAGGDEFVILLKEIGHSMLVKSASGLVKTARAMTFPEHDFELSLSVGVCYLPENISGYTYEQLFANADWALYQAKERGRNRYTFCDNLRRFEMEKERSLPVPEHIDARYLHNDIVSTAFELFEKMTSFDAAMKLLLEVTGLRLQLDRITVIQTDIQEKTTRKQYQWMSQRAPSALETPGGFTKEDFLILFNSYDEYGTTVLDHDAMDAYSESARALLMQGEAKTVVYAAMYCEGKYTGAISYVVCDEKRYWSSEKRRQLGELTKIISSHLAKHAAMNSVNANAFAPEYDTLTGLLSFPKFREEMERSIISGYAEGYAVYYTDFEDFKYLNRRFGYTIGDRMLKDFAAYIVDTLQDKTEVYFTRVISDQFILFMPFVGESREASELEIHQFNERFVRQQAEKYPDIYLRMRTGIYFIEPECLSASAAIDAANFARRQIQRDTGISARLYDKEMLERQVLENELISDMHLGMQQNRFKVYLQPRFSLENYTVVGAEALVRFQREDGTLIYPDEFVPLYEETGKIIDLDFYVFDQVVGYLAKNERLGRRQVPISVNASILHASKEWTAKRYLEILEKHGVSPQLTEIELTETATVSDYSHVRQLFQTLQEQNMMTAMDDFGAGYSVLNSVIDIPVNTVKIDRKFVENCEASEKGIYLLKQLIALVKGLGYHVVCEGLETENQVKILREAGCEEGQGFWFAKPMTIEEFEAMMYDGENPGRPAHLLCQP